MTIRRPAVWLFSLLVSTLNVAPALATPPVLLSAVSRMEHGAGGKFDVQLPLSGGSGVECRAIANGGTILLTFDQPVTSATATVTAGGATVNGTPTFATNVMIVKLAGLADATAVTLNVANVANAAAEVLSSQNVAMRVLFGDINGDGRLTASDTNLTRAAVGAGLAVNGGNFRCDVSVDGAFTSSDTNRVRAAVGAGAGVDGGPTNNTPPTIGTINAQTVATGTAMSPVGFTVGDTESDASTLVVSSTSSDQVTVPNNSITVSGSGTSRAISLTPAVGVTSTVPVTITLYVSDGLAFSDPVSFVVSVTPPPITYLATLQPIGGTGSLGSGTALLTVSGDGASALLSYTASNLSSAETDETVNGGDGAILYDLPVGRNRGDLQMDGYHWTFNTMNAASYVAALAKNDAYFHIETALHPAGEMAGTFKPLSGSQVFNPPAPPPVISINPPTPADASRFLQQAAFGGTAAEIAVLADPNAPNASTAINDWLNAQFAQPVPVYPNYTANKIAPASTQPSPQSDTQPYTPSSLYWNVYNRVTTPQGANAYADTLGNDRLNEAWWKTVVTAPDPLRHRVATALSEIFVVSENDGTIDGNIPGLSSYYDMLADDAFGNFRTLLGEVTLHPIMGKYLNMLNSTRATPNENFAREIMQLFSVGLYMLQPDGTLMLDNGGKPIPTYSQTQVTSLAAVYTGWAINPTKPVIPTFPVPVAPATQPTVVNFTSQYQQPMTVNTPTNHSGVAKTLLSYPGATTTTIPATTGTMTAAIANAELNVALDNLFNHPNVGPFISKQLIQRLVVSNPTPGYVYRVTQKFNNNGSGVRGDMKAVLTAILTDYEARSPDVRGNAGYGKMREPIVRLATLLHTQKATSKTGKWTIGKTDSSLSQTLFRAPTVFNFFDPTYAQPGVIQQAGLVSPEFQIVYETTITNAQNQLYTGIYANYNADGTPKLTGTGFGSDVYLDLSGLVTLCGPASANTDAMLEQVILTLGSGPLDATGQSKARIVQYLNTLAANNPLARVQAAVHLVATSSQAAVQK